MAQQIYATKDAAAEADRVQHELDAYAAEKAAWSNGSTAYPSKRAQRFLRSLDGESA